MNDQGPTELTLIGYVPLTQRGFALPCFATSPRSNVWYTAICSVDADHAGKIIGFEVFESNDILRLTSELRCAVRVGSAWKDVFLWRETVFVGTPREIWDALGGERHEMLLAVPLTGLDLALAIPDENVTPLIGSALEFMRGRFGAERAEAWRSGTLARQQLLIGLRRLVRELGLGHEALAAIGNLEIVPIQANQLSVRLPSKIVEQFSKLSRSDRLTNRIRETFEKLGLVVSEATAEPSDTLAASLEASPSKPDPNIENAKQERVVRILIVASEGRRARDVARHIIEPDWKPDWVAESHVILETETIDQPTQMATNGFFGQRHREDELSSTEHDVVVLLVDEEHLSQAHLFDLHGALAERAGSKWTGVSLLAPILPEDLPSEILMGGAKSEGGSGNFGFDAVIDTSVARSPFWSGNPRRSLDRRIADVVVGAALLCSGQSPLRKVLKQERGRREALLTFALVKGSVRQAQIGLASEATWPNRGSKHGELWSAGFSATGGRQNMGAPAPSVVQIRERREGFEDFAAAVMTSIAGILPKNLIKRPLPARLRSELTWPKLSAGFRFGRTAFRGVAICAEAPSLAALRAAGLERWAVIRYTDTESIRETADLGSELQLPYLPRQLRLPNITKRPENRGLATRGIDPRDAVRLTSQEWQSWKSRLSKSLRGEARLYITSLSQPHLGHPASADEPEFVLPRREVQRVGQADHEAAVALLRYVDRRDQRDQRSQSAGKRLADLRVAWSRPADGASRYILADGVIPSEFVELEPDEVPAQRFFIIDGDAAVPALLGSRIFAAWAKITLTRSTSWMPRFSVSRTFETFPVPPPFLLERIDGGPTQLRMAGNERLRNRAEDLRRNYRERSMDSVRKLHREIDRTILRGLKLDESAPDLAIIELLLQSEYRRYV
jgi:hypothetical protein